MKGRSDRGTGRSDGGLYYVCDGAADYRAAFISRASFVRHRLLIHAALPALLATAAMQPARAQTFIAETRWTFTPHKAVDLNDYPAPPAPPVTPAP